MKIGIKKSVVKRGRYLLTFDDGTIVTDAYLTREDIATLIGALAEAGF